MRCMRLFLAAMLVCAAADSAAAQKFLPKSIVFQGDSEYSDTEILAAAGLRSGVLLDYSAMQSYSQRLLNTGIFETVSFKLDGENLIFTLMPASGLVPAQIDNLPVPVGKTLDQEIHDLVPLYHGKVPAEGGLADDVDAALQKILAGEGIKVTVTELPVTDQTTQQIDAVSYSIADPQVRFNVANIDGVSNEFRSKIRAVLSAAEKKPFSFSGSAADLERALKQFYSDQGYTGAKIEVSRSGNLRMDSKAIVVPYSVQVDEGSPASQ